MKVETPQILWHQVINPTQKKEAGKNSPILSCSLLDCTDGTGVLATAGNTEVNLWRVHFIDNSVRVGRTNILVKPQLSGAGTSGLTTTAALDNDDVDMSSDAPSPYSEHTRVEHIITLTRGTNERNINAVKFSPDGHHLAAAGDGGTVVVWSTSSTANNNKQSWKLLQAETDLQMKIIFNQSDDVMDIAWSSDSKRFTVCSLDHTLTVWEKNYVNKNNNEAEWRNVHRSGKDHTHYIQGVAVDPKGVYMASQGSDRMVKVYTRKTVKENVIKGELNKYEVVRDPSSSSSSDSAAAISNQDGVTTPPDATTASTDDKMATTIADDKKAIREGCNKVIFVEGT
jgi:WD40 repeat protein